MELLLLATFIAYFVVVIGVGAYFYNRSAKMKEYFLADRQLNPYVVALSAQASDMSGWLLMGLPGSILVAGVGEIWVGIGLAIGTYLAWLIIAKRLRVYSEKVNNAITISEYFSNRFNDKNGTLRILCGIVILVFFTFYVASAFVSGGKVLLAIFPDSEYLWMMLAGALIIIIYTFMGGFKAVCWTDFFQGILMLIAIVIIPLAITGQLGGVDAAWEQIQSIAAVDPDFSIDFIQCGWIAILSGLAWGIGYFGMPHIHVRYMAIKNAEEIRISRRVATIWVIIALGCACLIGLIGRAWAEANGMSAEVMATPENILIFIVNDLWAVAIPVLAGLIFAALMAAVMSTADSQLLVASSSISNDIYKHFKGDSISEERLVWISRGIVIAVAAVAAFIAMDPASSIMELVSFAWAGFGAAFGPLMILSLFWKRTNKNGAIAGIITGFVVTIVWNTFLRSCILGKIFGISGLVIDTPVTGLYELLPAFIIAGLVIIVVSLLTGKPTEDVEAVFDEVDAECRRSAKPFTCTSTAKAGILAAVLFFAGLLISIVLNGVGETVAHNTIGDLLVAGGWVAAMAFIAIFVGGSLVAICGYCMCREKSQCSQVAGILILVAGIAMALAGLIDMGYDVHYILRNTAVCAGVVALPILLGEDILAHRAVTVGVSLLAVAVFMGFWAAGLMEVTVAISLALMAFLTVQSVARIGREA
ncbi:MAG: sodium/proline symporter PutP [Candidatus Methanomethylophilaceae archaeon]